MKTIEEVAEFHGHVCPGLALGYRVALAALGALGQRAGDEELVAIVENDSCAVDAVQVMTGCTFGKGNLYFRDYGKQAYTFIRRPSGDAVRIAVTWEPPSETAGEAAAWKSYSAGDRSEDILRAVHERKSRKIASILDAPEDQVLSVRLKRLDPPPTARIYPSVRCTRCGEKTMESRARLSGGEIVCIPCGEEAGR